MIGVIYKYTSPSGKIYVGQTINPKVAQSNSKYKKPIVCVETNVTYASVYDAERELNIRFGNIWSVCNGKRKTAGGYHWKYKTI